MLEGRGLAKRRQTSQLIEDVAASADLVRRDGGIPVRGVGRACVRTAALLHGSRERLLARRRLADDANLSRNLTMGGGMPAPGRMDGR